MPVVVAADKATFLDDHDRPRLSGSRSRVPCAIGQGSSMSWPYCARLLLVGGLGGARASDQRKAQARERRPDDVPHLAVAASGSRERVNAIAADCWLVAACAAYRLGRWARVPRDRAISAVWPVHE